MMLGLLLARAGVEVTVLEKHGDFLRDFRGDTVHASTIRLIDELGLGDGFRKLPQSKLNNVAFPIPGVGLVTLGDFATLKPPYNYIAMMPQWDFLNFLATEAASEPTFTLLMEHEATSLMFDGGRVTGVRYRTRGGTKGQGTEGALHADLVVATDGRHSVLRRAAGLQPKDYPVPFDTWWFKLPRHASEKGAVAGIVPAFRDREAMIALFRDDYYQMGYLGPKERTRGYAPRALNGSGNASPPCVRTWRTGWTPSVRSRTFTGWMCGWTGCGAGTWTGCCASATPPMPCPQRAGWASTWPSRMPWRQRHCWHRPWSGATCRSRTSRRWNGGAGCPPSLSRPSKGSCTGRFSFRCSPDGGRVLRRSCCFLSGTPRWCGGSCRGSSPSDPGRNMRPLLPAVLSRGRRGNRSCP